MRYAGVLVSTWLLGSFCLLNAQQIAVGVKGGVRASDDVDGFSLRSSESKRYIVGPAVELRLPWRLGVEFDALYRRFGYTSESQFASLSHSIIRERGNSWEFPLLAKYRIPGRLVQPFAGAGYDWRKVNGSDVSSGYYLSGQTTNPPADIYTYYFNQRRSTDYPVGHGVVISGGIDLNSRHLRVSPEFRYVRWRKQFLSQVGGDGSYFLQSSQNEYFILVGISWH